MMFAALAISSVSHHIHVAPTMVEIKQIFEWWIDKNCTIDNGNIVFLSIYDVLSKITAYCSNLL